MTLEKREYNPECVFVVFQLSSFTENTRGLLLSLFFIRRLQVMQEFFHMCTQFAAAIQGLDGGSCFDEEQLSRPIKRFIADYVRKQVRHVVDV